MDGHEIHGGVLTDTPSSRDLWVPGEQLGEGGLPVLARAMYKTGMLSLLLVILGLLMLDLVALASFLPLNGARFQLQFR